MALDLHKVVDEIGFGGYHLMLIFFVGTFFTVDNSFLIMAACITTTLETDWGLNKFEKAALVSILFLGSAIGSVVSGSFSDIHGRRPMILISLFGELIFGVACALTNGPASMMVIRFMFGMSVGLGMAPVISMLVECTPTRWRGHMVNGVTGFMYGFGLLYACLVIMVYMPELDGGASPQTWRYVTALSVLPVVIVFPFVCLLVPESPHYLVGRGKQLEALHVLRFMAFINGRNHVNIMLDDEEKQTLSEMDNMGFPNPWITTGARVTSALLGWSLPNENSAASGSACATDMHHNAAGGKLGGVFDLVDTITTSGFLPTVKGGIFLYFLVNATVNGLNYGLPQILSTMTVDMSPAFSLFIVSLCDYPALILACAIVEAPWVSYRTAMKGLCFACFWFITMLISFDYGYSKTALFAVCFAKIVAGALFQLVFAYFGEVFPSSIRCTANCICMSAGRLGSVLGPINYELMSNPAWLGSHIGAHTLFFVFLAMMCLVGVEVITKTLTVEVKGNPLEDFDEEVHVSDLAPPIVGSRGNSRNSSAVNSRATSRHVSFAVSEVDTNSQPHTPRTCNRMRPCYKSGPGAINLNELRLALGSASTGPLIVTTYGTTGVGVSACNVSSEGDSPNDSSPRLCTPVLLDNSSQLLDLEEQEVNPAAAAMGTLLLPLADTPAEGTFAVEVQVESPPFATSQEDLPAAHFAAPPAG